MTLLAPGSPAPIIPGIEVGHRALVLFFYKVTCPVCQMAAPVADVFEQAYAGHIVGVGQDPAPKLDEFAEAYGMSFPSITDLPPYAVSDAYGIESVPTIYLIKPDRTVVDAAESWNRDGFNRVSRRLADLAGAEYRQISEHGDGLPPFRPG